MYVSSHFSIARKTTRKKNRWVHFLGHRNMTPSVNQIERKINNDRQNKTPPPDHCIQLYKTKSLQNILHSTGLHEAF